MSNQLIPHDAAATVAAGGIVAPNAKLPADERTSPIGARAYRHPALQGGEIVVRLEPEAVAAGVDAEMAAFGFGEPEVGGALGKVRYRTLGFPAWALVHQPAKAKIALGVTDDLRKAKRMVASRPGQARDAFEKIAKTLQKSAPQFLPSFWEEAGRVVADQASAAMAAQFFERARAAERAFKLKSDPDDSDAVFVEFALLGALSAKTLSQYAKDLAKSAGGGEAYRRFRAIAIKRALGGMPPWSGMGKDLRTLAAAAKLDLADEDDKLLAELIEAPNVGKAPAELWATYEGSLERLAGSSAEARARLRTLWPEPRGGSDESRTKFKHAWLARLVDIGALSDLPDAGLGAWVTRLIHYAGESPQVAELLRAYAPRLAGHKIATMVSTGRWWGENLHLDLTELALELALAIEDPTEDSAFAPDTMSCNPVLTAAEPRYGKKLVEAVAHILGDADHEHRMRGKSGFDVARRAWIEDRLNSINTELLCGAADAIGMLDSKTTADTFVAFPELHARLASASLAGPLAATLRAGIPDEFTWPAYEAAYASLGSEVWIGGLYPTLVLYDKAKAIAVGARGVIAEHDLVYKKDKKVGSAFYLAGEFLVQLELAKGWGDSVVYWSSAPKTQREMTVRLQGYGGDVANAWTLPDGRVTVGKAAFGPGDAPTDLEWFLCDGERVWTSGEGGKTRELDLATGKKGAASTPAFLTGWDKPGFELDRHRCQLFPAPEGTELSPLGYKDGLLGVRVRRRDNFDRAWDAERIDGVTWSGDVATWGLVTFPGGDPAPRPIQTDSYSSPKFPDNDDGPGVELYSPSGKLVAHVNEHEWAACGWGKAPVPPAAFWDYLTARDEAGSRGLRAIDDAVAGELLAAAGKDPGGVAALAKARLGITDDALARGVAGIAAHAAELQARLDEVASMRSADNADPSGVGLTTVGLQVRKLARALSSVPARPLKLADFDVDIRPWLTHGRALAVASRSPLADADKRRQTREILSALAGSALADDVSAMRILEISETDGWSDPEDWGTLVVKAVDGSTFAIHGSENWAIELSRDGTFRTPEPWNVDKATTSLRGIGSDWARGFLALPEAVPWDPAIAVALAEAAGLSVAEATLYYLNPDEMTGYSKDFLGKAKRELVGLKMGDADAARTTFKDLDDDVLDGMIAKAVPDDPAMLATPLAPGGLVAKLGSVWKAKFGKRAKVDQALVAAVKKDLEHIDHWLGDLLAAFGGDLDSRHFKPELRPLPSRKNDSSPALNGQDAEAFAKTIAWLAYARPVGCTMRAGIPAVLAGLEGVLGDERVVWELASLYLDHDVPADKKRGEALLEMVGGDPVTMPSWGDGTKCEAARDDGACSVGIWGSRAIAGFRPGKLHDARARAKMEALALAMVDRDDDYGNPLADLQVAELLRSDGFAAIAARVTETEVPVGGFEANPMASVPKLVGKVAKVREISAEAAALYLQVLALAEPTERAVCAFNGWSAKEFKAAAAELVKKKLVTEGKRERAGRSIFLAGGYDKGRGKNLPMEDWKQPFYKVLDRHLPLEPCDLLFARAWKRVEDGDKPA